MSEFRNPIDQFIKELGGTHPVARALGLAPSVVSAWRSTGRIPKWRIAALAELAVERNVSFPVMEKAA